MKVLWLCNIVLPEFSGEFDIPVSNVGGWLTGMWKEINKRDDIELGICCPIKDEWRMKDGTLNTNKYYSFHFSSKSEYSSEQEIRFIEIIKDFKPDIIHIWGTEFVHTLAMINACEKCGLLDKAVINIQGLVSVCAKHYTNGLPYDVAMSSDIQNQVTDFQNRGIFEIEALEKVHHVIGRTDWDKACTTQINPDVHYHFCNEIIRDVFYDCAGSWDYDKCEKHSIFVSQASYPVKGFHYVLEALPLVIKRFPDTYLYVAGTNANNSYGEYIQKLIEEKQLEKHITFMGMLSEDEMCKQFMKSNVFVSASTIENESNSISEAKMLGVPVISSYVGGVINRIVSGYDGMLYPCNEPYMLAYYVCQIFENRTIQNDIFVSAVKKADKINNKENNGLKCIDVYGKICDENMMSL